MIECIKLKDSISKCAWGYLFLYFNVNFGRVNILPYFVAFWLFLSAIDALKAVERELSLLTPLGLLLFWWHLALWIAACFGYSIEGLIPGANLVMCVVNLYFHFQLLTNLASVAVRYQPVGAEYDKQLLRYRTRQTVLFTAMMALTELAVLFGSVWAYISMAMGFVYLVAGVCMTSSLFGLRKNIDLPDEA